ncbi:hypothetical protein LPJ61_000269 [Coemansia biformis]|uniref:TPR-like protein n=1 Tax=Coemansia biformis TaxID=1286918 RepID=A0A9W7YH26_9FUNG|nr:hypothetical protein LPJ61_000269 [Coemansia biformis]
MAPNTALLSEGERRAILGQPAAAAAGQDGGDAGLGALLASGDYEAMLQSPAARAIFGTDLDGSAAIEGADAPSPSDAGFSAGDIQPLVAALVGRHVQATGPDAWKQITLVGAACLSAFVQTNWTGPEFQLDPAALLPRALAERWRESFISAAQQELPEDAAKHEVGRREQKGRVYLGATQSEERTKLDRALLKLMEADGEEAYALAPRPLYLYLARLLLVDIPSAGGWLSERREAAPSAHWWAARALSVQQSLLDYPAQTLMDQIVGHFAQARQYMPASPASAALEKAQGHGASEDDMPIDDAPIEDPPVEDAAGEGGEPAEGSASGDEGAGGGEWGSVAAGDRELWARYLTELGVVYTQYKQPLDAKRYFALAQAASGLQWLMTGAKGKRTRFQKTDVVQLVLLATSARRAASESGAVPESMELNDEVLLERAQLADQESALANQADLATIDKCILLALCLNVQNENPAHGLTSEQMMPFVVRVLEHPGNWSVYTVALVLRSRLEAGKMRTVERATLQMQTLVDQITHPLPGADEAGGAERLHYLYALALPSQWELERELASMFLGLGVVRSALDIYERLQMWDEVVSCYTVLGQTEVAERIVRRELDASPDSPKLWCVLGDLKGDPELWRRAWDVSGQRFARAMRSLGRFHFDAGEFAAAVECYRKAVALNPLVENSWFVLGCAAMSTQEWRIAADAFLHVVGIDDNSGESWNNLATVYLRLGKDYQRRALHALRESVKFMPDSWRVWSNLMHVSMSLGLLASAASALGRVVDLRVAQDGADCVDLDVLRAIIGRLVHGAAFPGLPADEAAHAEQRLATQLERLLVRRIEARITSSAPLWRAMADFWLWRRDYRHCLDCYVKAYRCLSQLPQVAYAPPVFNDAADAALELVDMYENLGDRAQVVRAPGPDGGPDDERKAAAVEQPVCADWRRQSQLLLRGLIGKAKESFDGTPAFARLTDALTGLRQ